MSVRAAAATAGGPPGGGSAPAPGGPPGGGSTPAAAGAPAARGSPVVGVAYVAAGAPPPWEPWWFFLVSYANFRITTLTFLFWFAAMALHTSATFFTLHRGTTVHPGLLTAPPLHDVGHELLPDLRALRVLPEVGHVAPVLLLGGLMLFHFDQRSLDGFRTFLWCHGSLMALRAASFTSTLLPDASQACHASAYLGSCHDLVFSGHVMIMTLAVLHLHHFFPEALTPALRVALAANLLATSVLVVATRNHYTVDVVLSLTLTPFVFTAWTRHPALVALAAVRPERVLALPSKLAAAAAAATPAAAAAAVAGRGACCGGRAGTGAGAGAGAGVAGGAWEGGAGAPRRLARDGYPAVDGAAVDALTRHAHATLKLLSLRPRVVVLGEGGARVFADDGAAVDGGGGGDDGAAAPGGERGSEGGGAGEREGGEEGGRSPRGGGGGGGGGESGGTPRARRRGSAAARPPPAPPAPPRPPAPPPASAPAVAAGSRRHFWSADGLVVRGTEGGDEHDNEALHLPAFVRVRDACARRCAGRRAPGGGAGVS